MAIYGHWEFPGEFHPDDWFGFIYRIIHNATGKEYIGKKQLHSYTRKKVKGRKNRKKVVKESNWQKYTSSSVAINDLIALHGIDSFTFRIESLHKTRASLTYAEVERMIVEDVLRAKDDDGTRKYYNGVIPPIKFLPPHETDDEEAARIFNTIKDIYPNDNFAWEANMSEEDKQAYRLKYRFGVNNSARRKKTVEEYEKYLNENFRGPNNPMYGRTGKDSPRYGTHPFEKLSPEDLADIKKLMSHPGKKNGMHGRHPFANLTEAELEVVKEKMVHRGEKNGMYGKSPYYKMTEEEKQQWKDNISKGSKGIPKSEIAKERMRKPKGPQLQVECPHCKKVGGVSNMTRYHFNNCKQIT